MKKSKTKYYRVEGMVVKPAEHYVEAKNEIEARDKAEEMEGDFLQDVEIEEISEEKYENEK